MIANLDPRAQNLALVPGLVGLHSEGTAANHSRLKVLPFSLLID